MPTSAGPIRPEERILVIDIVRGVALLGIFVMNIPGFGHSLFAGAADGGELVTGLWDRAAAFVREAFFAGKFNTMFSLLFGIGFTIQLGRLQATVPERAAPIYVRRLLVLLGLGLVHAGLLWNGDVLLVYAVLGFALLLLQRAPDKVLILLIAACLVFPGIFDAWRPQLVSPEAEALAAFDYRHLEASNNEAFGTGSFLDAVRETSRMFAWGYGTPMGRWSYALFYAHMATGMLLGYWVGRRGWVGRLGSLQREISRIQWAALTLAAVAALGQVALAPGVSATEPLPARVLAAGFLHSTGRLGLTLFYILTLVRLAESTTRWRRLLLPFASAGRMPLSNYLLQTAMGTFIFYGWGLGYWGRTRPALELLLAPLLFVAIQLPLSAWWLRRFRYGPLEYAWRLLSYGRSAT